MASGPALSRAGLCSPCPQPLILRGGFAGLSPPRAAPWYQAPVQLQRSRTAGAPIAVALTGPHWRLGWCPLRVSSGGSEAVLEAVVQSDTYMAQARSAQVCLLPLFACAVWDENLHSSGLRPQINMQLCPCDRWRW